MPLTTEIPAAREVPATDDTRIQLPEMSDGAEMWRIARDSASLDLNSSYAYMLYARDFPRTCRIAVVDGTVAGFVLGNLQPERPDCLFVWQIAVDERFRGRGLAGRLLDDLVDSLLLSDGLGSLETTITDDNTASQRLFRDFARRRGNVPVVKSSLFEEEHFPDGHDAEPLYQIGPLRGATPTPEELHEHIH